MTATPTKVYFRPLIKWCRLFHRRASLTRHIGPYALWKTVPSHNIRYAIVVDGEVEHSTTQRHDHRRCPRISGTLQRQPWKKSSAVYDDHVTRPDIKTTAIHIVCCIKTTTHVATTHVPFVVTPHSLTMHVCKQVFFSRT